MRANRVPEWQERDWRTFAAKDCSDIAKAVHLATVAADPVTPVAPARPPAHRGAARRRARGRRPDRRGPEAATTAGTRSRSTTSPASPASSTTRSPRGRDGAWTTPEAGRVGGRRRSRPDRVGARRAPAAAPGPPLLRATREPGRRAGAQGPAGQGDAAALSRAGVPRARRRRRRPPHLPAAARPAAAGAHRPGPAAAQPVARRRRAHPRWPTASCRSPRLAVQRPARRLLRQRPQPRRPRDLGRRRADPRRRRRVFDVVDVDPDGSAIKAERFLTTIPRLAIAQAAEDAGGCRVARHARERAHRHPAPAGRAGAHPARPAGRATRARSRWRPRPQDLPLLHTQDVTRGVRVEVWDSVSRVWHSLHSRRSTLLVEGTTVYTDDLNDGFIQGTSATETREVPDSADPRPRGDVRLGGVEPVRAAARASGCGPCCQRRPRWRDARSPRRPSRRPPTPRPARSRRTPSSSPTASPRAPSPGCASAATTRSGRGPSTSPATSAPTTWARDRPPSRPSPRARSALAPLSDRALSRRLASASARDVPALASAFTAAAAAAPTAAEVEAARLRDLGLDDTRRRWPAPSDRPRTRADARARRARRTAAAEVADRARRRPPARRRSPPPTCTPSCSAPGPRPPRRRRGSSAVDAGEPALRDLGVRGCRGPARAGRAAGAARRHPVSCGRGRARRSARPRRREPSSGARCAPTSTTARDLIAGHLADLARRADGRSTPPGRSCAHAAATVTPPRPFLRWDPVPPPVVVPAHGVHRGRVAARRRGPVGRDPGPRHARGDDPGPGDLRGIRRRHRPALRRGRASGTWRPRRPARCRPSCTASSTPASTRAPRPHARRMLAWALRESGTFYDQSVPHPTEPDRGARRPSPASGCCPSRWAATTSTRSDPNRPLKVLPPAPPGTPDELVLKPGRRARARAVRRARHTRR